MKLLIRLFVNTVAVFGAAYILSGVQVDSPLTAFIVAIVLGTLNAFIRPLLVLLTLPITILTLGLFTLVINAFMVIIVAILVPGFIVGNVISALIFSVLVSLISGFLNKLVD